MRVTCILGSPRPRDNSAVLAGCFCAEATKRGALVEPGAVEKRTDLLNATCAKAEEVFRTANPSLERA